jgi:hypothetical protein
MLGTFWRDSDKNICERIYQANRTNSKIFSGVFLKRCIVIEDGIVRNIRSNYLYEIV